MRVTIRITKQDIDNIESWKYLLEHFNKFDDPTNPQYELYKNKIKEKYIDKGFNLGIEHVVSMLRGKFRVHKIISLGQLENILLKRK